MVEVSGPVFGKYEVLRRLAAGGMGEIYLARQTGIVDRWVTLKSLLPSLADDAQALAQFLDEARILGSISHPNVVALYDVGEWAGTHFIAMEFIHGVDVSQLLSACEEQKQRLPPIVSAQVVAEAALGLDAAHVALGSDGNALRIVHRDISPHNIMVRADGLVKVVDFGVAVAEHRQQKTDSNLLKGKLGYMAPEQIKGAPVEPKSDQFALGVLLWEMLTQRRLFTGENAAQVFMRILRETPAPPSSVAPDVPPVLDAVVVRMTSMEPVDRFPRMADAAFALRRALESLRAPDNATLQFIKQTVGPMLQARQKELATAAIDGASGKVLRSPTGIGTNPGRAPTGTGRSAFCARCGTQALGGDRFCRSCGENLGTPLGTPRVTPVVASPAAAPAPTPTAQAPPRVGTAPPAVVPPAKTPGPRARFGPTQIPSIEHALLAGVLELRHSGRVAPADGALLQAALVALQEVGARYRGTAQNNGAQFSVAFVGEGALRDAVLAARALPRAVQRITEDLMVRAGIAGDAHLPPERVNVVIGIAEHLASLAAPGAVIVSEPVRARVDALAGRSAQVTVGTESVLAHELAQPRRLLGRHAELSQLDAVLDDAIARRGAQLLFLGGGGLGKTALLEQARTGGRERGLLVASAWAAARTAPLSLTVLRQLLRGVARALLTREGHPITAGFTAALEFLAVPAVDARRLRALVDEALDASDDAFLDATPPHRRRALLKAAVASFFERALEDGPILLLIDDIHRGDAASFEILGEMAARLADRGLAVIAAGQPQQGERVLPLARRVMLPSLSPADLQRLTTQQLGAPAPAELFGIITERALGNPLLVALLLRYLTRLQAVSVTARGVEVQPQIRQLFIPNNPTALFHAAHTLLHRDAQTTIAAAALVGQFVEARDLSAVVDGVTDVPGMLKSLVEGGVLEREEDSETGFRFRSTSELESILDRLQPEWSRPLHHRLARVVERSQSASLQRLERLVWHLDLADPQTAVAPLERCALRTGRLGLYEVAANDWRRLLELDAAQGAPDESRARAWLEHAAQACASLAEVDAVTAVEVVLPALKAVPAAFGAGRRAEVLRQRARVLARLKRTMEAEDCIEEARATLELAPEEERVAVLGDLLLDHGQVLDLRGDIEAARERLDEAVEFLRIAPSSGTSRLPEALISLGRVFVRSRDLPRAQKTLQGARAESAAAGNVAQEAEAVGLLAALAQQTGDLHGALSLVKEAAALARSTGDPLVEARLRTQGGRILIGLGKKDEAGAALRAALELARQAQWDEGASAAQQLLAGLG